MISSEDDQVQTLNPEIGGKITILNVHKDNVKEFQDILNVAKNLKDLSIDLSCLDKAKEHQIVEAFSVKNAENQIVSLQKHLVELTQELTKLKNSPTSIDTKRLDAISKEINEIDGKLGFITRILKTNFKEEKTPMESTEKSQSKRGNVNEGLVKKLKDVYGIAEESKTPSNETLLSIQEDNDWIKEVQEVVAQGKTMLAGMKAYGSLFTKTNLAPTSVDELMKSMQQEIKISTDKACGELSGMSQGVCDRIVNFSSLFSMVPKKFDNNNNELLDRLIGPVKKAFTKALGCNENEIIGLWQKNPKECEEKLSTYFTELTEKIGHNDISEEELIDIFNIFSAAFYNCDKNIVLHELLMISKIAPQQIDISFKSLANTGTVKGSEKTKNRDQSKNEKIRPVLCNIVALATNKRPEEIKLEHVDLTILGGIFHELDEALKSNSPEKISKLFDFLSAIYPIGELGRKAMKGADSKYAAEFDETG